MARDKIGKFYATRDAKGHFVKWTPIGESLAADRRVHSRHDPGSPGRGNEGDYELGPKARLEKRKKDIAEARDRQIKRIRDKAHAKLEKAQAAFNARKK